jgi:hypothetical protein
MSDGGKGSRMRPVDTDKYNANFDRIFHKQKVRVSGVPYEVELETKTKEINNLIGDIDDLVAELERENFMLRARIERMENELKRYEDDGK